MLTAAQLDLLIYTQWGCDWTPQYFPEAVIEASKRFDISNLEVEVLMAWIEALNAEKIRFPANGSDAAWRSGLIFSTFALVTGH
ncbi:hypothetical protein NIES4075_69320 [Tolypothrix sp. NIES-4075]|uniref:hypothetical protein n=1 Tax=Tolypothrix sp. NIES-4075 TaxID=2005459 RepID=UPI000B5CF0BA|nr:hypothetical protein [Tolypothrix sp. NIES-4075]GAX45911.1 hypothetical protein NIES4075_69320 [Tolypothrix sp. NIES-4075]